MKNNILFSCENKQELNDINSLASILSEEGITAIIFYDLSPLYKTNIIEDEEDVFFTKTYRAVNFTNRSIKDQSIFLKLVLSIINAVYIYHIARKNEITHFFVGAPLLIFRIARLILPKNIRKFSFIRGLIATSSKDTSLSSALYHKFGGASVSGFWSSIFCDYYFDRVFCAGKVTANFLIERGVPASNVDVIGSISCDRLLNRYIQKSNTFNHNQIVFVCSAFAWHGNEKLQRTQELLILEIIDYLEKSQLLSQACLTIRVHPRESEDFYSKIKKRMWINIDYSCADPIDNYSATALYVSLVSTLVFEMRYVGFASAIISNEQFQDELEHWYSSVGIIPCIEWKMLIDQYIKGDDLLINHLQIDSVFSKKNIGYVAPAYIKAMFG